ncbi:MAG: DEAD/DEAH box helicase [Phycisphaerae bacterium]|jgi:ATP-dependent RNA helicase RhlE|nr:DEAD/DEAH box helicase [Phycisphaerae bacterium]
MCFKDLGLIEPLLRAVAEEGYTTPTPIQVQAIPPLLAGTDLLGCAQTGTGKTAAFALPILQRFHANQYKGQGTRPIRALIITPTRELASQISDSFSAYGAHTRLRHTVVFGGVRQGPQAKALKKGVDILVATPGRLLDLMGQKLIKLRNLEVFVLDEADRMLDMGFIIDIRRIIAEIPQKRQTLLFSATMPAAIQGLADSLLNDPVEVRVSPETPAAETVTQSVYLVEWHDKQALLEHLLSGKDATRVLIFTRTKRGADKVSDHLKIAGIKCDSIHSDKTQGARERALARFKQGKTPVLVASDVAARGIDIDDISHVINYDMPNEAEVYVHRIGRTGRAGLQGVAWSFCGVEERYLLSAVEELLDQTINIISDHPFPSPLPRRSQIDKDAAPTKKKHWRRDSKRASRPRRF